MSHLGEFELIGRIAASCHPERSEGSHPSGVLGIGDDCAVLPQREGLDTLVTTDLLIEGRHFLLADVTPEQLGWKSAAVNISDIAAMGGKPVASFLSIALPKGLAERFSTGPDPSENVASLPLPSLMGPSRSKPRAAMPSEGSAPPENRSCWIDRFMKGYSELCGKFGVPLLGGDTSASPSELFINVTVIGECPHGRALLRSSARPGDLICVTGPLGDSAAGLKLILENAKDASPELVCRHYLPMPRVEEGIALRECPGVHAMMDISDGIASDLRHILEASGAGAEIELAEVPLSGEMRAVCEERGWDAAELAVSGGEDYELLVTMAPEALDRARNALNGRLFVIGRIVEGDGIRWIGGNKEYKGFTHF